MGVAFGAALGLAVGVLALTGIDDFGIRAALLATARLMFLMFWPAYAGGGLVLLFGERFQPLRRHARELGLAFAAALSVHLGLVAWLCASGDIPPVRTFIVFGVAALCVYGLALLSIRRLQALLGPRLWLFVRLAGMNYVACAFADDFLHIPASRDLGHVLLYWPFAALAVIGPMLHIAAMAKSLRSSLSASPTG